MGLSTAQSGQHRQSLCSIDVVLSTARSLPAETETPVQVATAEVLCRQMMHVFVKTEAQPDDVTLTADNEKCPVHVLISRCKYLRLTKAVCTIDVCFSRLVPQCGCLQPTGQIQTHQPLLSAHLYPRRESDGKQTC